MKKYLILNADDFGMCQAYNEAVYALLSERKISSATLMPPTPGFEEAAAWCREHGVRHVGLHTTFTSEWAALRWKPLTDSPTLVDDSGYMHRSCEGFLRHAKADEVLRELDAQFARALDAGLDLSHVDNHMGSLYPALDGSGYKGYLKEVFARCAAHGRLPFRLFTRRLVTDKIVVPAAAAAEDIAEAARLGIPLVDELHSYAFSPTPGEDYASFKREVIGRLYAMPEGINELYIHPSVDCAQVRQVVPVWQKRVWEFNLPFDEDFTYALRDANITLYHYRDMREGLS